jgi:hypothetical protein
LRRLLRIPVALCAAVLLAGCSNAPKYLENRTKDLVDVVRVHLIAGQALGAQVEVTRFLSLGWTTERDAWAAGLHNRKFGKWDETISTWGLVVGRHEEQQVQGIQRVSGTYGWNFGKSGSLFQQANTKAFLDWFTLRGTAAVGLGIDLEVRLGEALDFLAGIIGWDPSDDEE